MDTAKQNDDVRTNVRDHYAEIAERIQSEDGNTCGCAPAGNTCCGTGDESGEKVVEYLYEDSAVSDLPAEVTDMSLGCGDPVTLASLTEGQTVLDLGSGGGIDCFLAAKKVGQTGKVIGVDMTPVMLDRARSNQAKLGADNVEFRLGEIENLPVADNLIDVIISNCVINLSPDKPAVFREAFRVLKPGGKLAVSDIATEGELPEFIKESVSAWAGCVSGALDVGDYVTALQDAGFENVEVKASYWDPDLFDAALGILEPELRAQVLDNQAQGKKSLILNTSDGVKILDDFNEDFDPQKSIFSAKITAWKPA
jgi:arsenite methyltransferase